MDEQTQIVIRQVADQAARQAIKDVLTAIDINEDLESLGVTALVAAMPSSTSVSSSASVSSSTFLFFQLLANLASFLIGVNDGATGAGALGKKLALAAVEATACGNEGTVIWAKRAEGRVARTG